MRSAVQSGRVEVEFAGCAWEANFSVRWDHTKIFRSLGNIQPEAAWGRWCGVDMWRSSSQAGFVMDWALSQCNFVGYWERKAKVEDSFMVPDNSFQTWIFV